MGLKRVNATFETKDGSYYKLVRLVNAASIRVLRGTRYEETREVGDGFTSGEIESLPASIVYTIRWVE